MNDREWKDYQQQAREMGRGTRARVNLTWAALVALAIPVLAIAAALMAR